jgi:hypothetical protein
MAVITGRIFDIVILSEKAAQIVLKKKNGDKIVPVAVTVFGWWKEKAINQMKLKPKDKIKGNLYLKSKLWNGKYLTDVYFKEVYLIEEAAPQIGSGHLFNQNMIEDDGFTVDASSGEIVE